MKAIARMEVNRRSQYPVFYCGSTTMPSLGLILLIVLIVLLLGSVPAWPYSRGWGYYPSGALGLVLLIVLFLFLFGML
jgi:hypothetical protein